MTETGPLLARPAPEGARLLALRYLREARRTVPRLARASDVEALHDFRVALRRLRSVLRAYRDRLGAAGGKKWRRRMAEVAAASGPGRDAEVQLAWVRARAAGASPNQRPGVAWLEARLVACRQTAYVAARDEVGPAFVRIADKLRGRLSGRARRRARLGGQASSTFGSATAELLRAHADELGAGLGRVSSSTDEARAHAARIAAKRLRYLLEPLAEERRGAAALIKRLKALQDVLGDLHDVHVMSRALTEVSAAAGTNAARRAVAPGVRMLAAAARQERERLFAQLRAQWTSEALRGLVAQVHELAEALQPRVRGSSKALKSRRRTARASRDAP